MKTVGLDIGSTTVKAICVEGDRLLWRDYKRHNTKQAECVLDFLARMEAECGLATGADRIFATGSGAGFIGPLIGAKFIQEVVAVAASVEKLHPDVRFVSEIGGEDMKTVFFTPTGNGRLAAESSARRITIPIQPAGKTATGGHAHRKEGESRQSSTVIKARNGGASKQVYMQSACSGGTGTFIEKTARKLEVETERLAKMHYSGMSLHKISSKCGIFAETDANTLVKSGVPVEEIIASLYEAVVYQNLATLTKGNTPLPEVLLLGGPNMFFDGLQQAWRHHLAKLWKERKIEMPDGRDPDSLILVPADALYYACLGCVEVGKDEIGEVARYAGQEKLKWWIEVGQHEEKARDGGHGLIAGEGEFQAFLSQYAKPRVQAPPPAPETDRRAATVYVGCDFGSTTAKAVVLSEQRDLLFHCYAQSKGNPIEDAKAILRQLRGAGYVEIGGMAITGYGKDLLKDIIGADVGIVETVAHATAALHFYPDADVICDVGGCDVKIMLLRQGTVSDFRLNSQCSSGNGAFLQGVAERYATPLDQYADKAFQARSIPTLAMGCGVFLQSDIVNQQRKGWSAEEIMASLAAVLPLNVWIYAGQLNNLAAAGKKFILQGGTHRNLAVVKAQVDFIRSKVPGAEIVVHPYPGEAGAIGAALCAIDWAQGGKRTRFRGFETVEALTYRSTTNEHTTCNWCPVNCRRTFIDVDLPGAKGRPWSKVPLAEGWERVISGNTCPKGLLEDANEMRVVKAQLEDVKRAHPNIAEMVREDAFRRTRSAGEAEDRDSESVESLVNTPVLGGVSGGTGS